MRERPTKMPRGRMSPARAQLQRRFGALIREARRDRGWSQPRLTHEVFSKTGIELSTQQVSAWETGTSAPECGFCIATILTLDLAHDDRFHELI